MKKLNRKGFTLIELLAVIVIMGILMMVAIPAMSKVIENSRKDTFVETAQTYANAVSTLWYADGLECQEKTSTGKTTTYENVSSAAPQGEYYVAIDTTATSGIPVLIERGGKSSWGNRNVYGYVRVSVPQDGKSAKFYVGLSDGIHGINEKNTAVAEKLKRRDVDLAMDTTKNNDLKLVTVTSGTAAEANAHKAKLFCQEV